MPEGVVNLVIGGGGEVGDAIINHPGIPLISFTGSTETGINVATAAARLNKRVSLEMGGKNAVIVMDDANLDLATDGILWSAFGTSGQRCTAASRVIVHRSVQAELVERLVARAGKMKLGDGLDTSVDVGPVVSASSTEIDQQLHRNWPKRRRPTRDRRLDRNRRRTRQTATSTSRRSSTTRPQTCASLRRRSLVQ